MKCGNEMTLGQIGVNSWDVNDLRCRDEVVAVNNDEIHTAESQIGESNSSGERVDVEASVKSGSDFEIVMKDKIMDASNIVESSGSLTLKEVVNKDLEVDERGDDSKFHTETAESSMVSSPSGQSKTRQRPGVILLGRGNSFSLGRSEVIVIHHRHKHSLKEKRTNRRLFESSANKTGQYSDGTGNANGKGDDGNGENLSCLQTINERLDSDRFMKLDLPTEVDGNEANYPKIPSPSPPPVSNGLYHSKFQEVSNETSMDLSNVVQLEPYYQDDLKDLWQKAESVMALRNERVRTILEEFGIGEPGGGGGEDNYEWEDEDVQDRKKEEEEVWRIIQDNFQA